MKKFKFSLETLLKVKNILEDKQRTELKKINDEIKIKQALLDGIESDIRNIQKNIKCGLVDKICIDKLKLYESSLNFKRKMKMEVLREIEQLQFHKEHCIRALVAVIKERKALDKLKEKEYLEYMYELSKQQEKESSDYMSYQVSASKEA